MLFLAKLIAFEACGIVAAWSLFGFSVHASAIASKTNHTQSSSIAQQSVAIRQDFHLRIRISNDSTAPASTRLAAKVLGQEVQLAMFQHEVGVHGQRYEVKYQLAMPKVVATVSGIDVITRSAVGVVSSNGLQGQQILEQRGGKGSRLEARLQADGKTVEFLKNQKKLREQVLSATYTDLTSLPYFWLGKPVKPGKIRIDVIDATKIYQENFIGRQTNVQFQGQSLKAIQFDRVKRTPDDADLSVLVRESDGFPLRVDLGLSAKYGVTAMMFPHTIPNTILKIARF